MALLLLVSLLVLAHTTISGQVFDDVVITSTRVTDDIIMLEGRGGNILVHKGDRGVLMVDSQYAPLSDKIKSAIEAFSNGELYYLINTHWHGDHVGGNENFAAHGANIVAHDNVLQRMSQTNLMKAFSREVPPSPEAARPKITFQHEMKLIFNGEPVIVQHVDNAHTDGDAIIYLPQSNVMHLGDTYFKDRFPFIDLGSKGSINGMIDAANTSLMLADDETKIIPGHGSLSNRAELVVYGNMLQMIRDRVQVAIDSGQSEEDLDIAQIVAGFESFDGGFINSERFVGFVFNSIKTTP